MDAHAGAVRVQQRHEVHPCMQPESVAPATAERQASSSHGRGPFAPRQPFVINRSDFLQISSVSFRRLPNGDPRALAGSFARPSCSTSRVLSAVVKNPVQRGGRLSARKARLVPANPPCRQKEANVHRPGDFTDPKSERVLDVAARAVARELGRQFARELYTRSHR